MLPTPRALDDLSVVEIGDWSLAYCGKLLADLGADVIKVETADSASRSPVHLRRFYDAGKRRLVLDQGRVAQGCAGELEVLQHLRRHADVVIDHGIDPESESPPPERIHVTITPFGRSGPLAHFRGSDLIGQAAGGMVYPNGFPDRPPLQVIGLQAYHSAGVQAAIAILLALLERSRSGRGQEIDISIQECVAANVEHVSSLFFASGTVAHRQGTLHWTQQFRQARCRDGNVLLSTLGDWTTLVEWVQEHGPVGDLGDPRWQSESQRRTHGGHLLEHIAGWAETQNADDIVAAAQLRRLPFAPVLSLTSLTDNPQLRARRFFVPAAEDVVDETRPDPLLYPGAPFVASRTPWHLSTRAPRPDEHGTAIRASLDVEAVRVQGEAVSATVPRGQALAGVRVLDFTWVVAGPAATRVFADHGADVIKIESPAAGNGNRHRGLFANLNRGKRSLALDLHDRRGRDIATRLVASADVLIDNFSARVMPELGLDYENLRQIKPDIVAVRMTGFGTSGPWRDHVSYGPTLQALCGFADAMRHPGDPPTGLGFSYSDMAAGHMAALATLIALRHRRRTGEGQQIDLAQLECLAALLGPHLVHRRGTAPDAAHVLIGNSSQEMPSAPHGVYRCADRDHGPRRDRWCAIAVFGDEDWQRFRSSLGGAAWTSDPRFSSHGGRVAHRARLDQHIETWTRRRRAESVMSHLQAHGLAAAVVSDAEDLCARDPQLRYRGFWCRVGSEDAAGTGMAFVDGSAARLSETPAVIRTRAPLLGEHSDTVLTELLGLTPAELLALRRDNVVA